MSRNSIYVALLTAISFVGLTGGRLFAQQEALYTQYMFNRLAVNPAYAGTKGYGSATALYRHQWTSYPGQPSTFALSAHGPISSANSGVGGYLVYDRLGAERNIALGATYAYRIRTGTQSFLSLGITPALLSRSINFDDVVLAQEGDAQFPNDRRSVVRPDVGLGAFFNTGKFYAGLSMAHLIEFDINLTANDQAKLRRHTFATVGYDFRLNDELILTPSTFVRYVAGAPVQADFNACLMMLQQFWAGASYRTNDAVALLVGFYPTKQLRIGYSYDVTTSSFNTNNRNGSHEIMLSIDFGDPNKACVVTPRYF